MKQFITAIIFTALFLGSLPLAEAVPPGVGTITQLVNVDYPSTVYIGKTYFIKANALDVSNDPVKDYSCAIEVKKTSTNDTVARLLVKDWCKEHLTTLPANDVPFACYYTTFSSGSIVMPTYIDPAIFESNTNYTVELSCGDMTTTKTTLVLGVADGSCNVSGVKINDGTDSTTDVFDENPNKLDTLFVSYFLESYNTICNGKDIRYNVLRDVNGTWVGHSEVMYAEADINGTGVIPLEINPHYFVDGSYKLVVMADDKSDSATFTVGNVRPYQEGYETLDWATQNMNGLLALITILILILIGLYVIWRIAF